MVRDNVSDFPQKKPQEGDICPLKALLTNFTHWAYASLTHLTRLAGGGISDSYARETRLS